MTSGTEQTGQPLPDGADGDNGKRTIPVKVQEPATSESLALQTSAPAPGQNPNLLSSGTPVEGTQRLMMRKKRAADKRFRNYFGTDLPYNEHVLHTFLCALEESVLIQGKLYISANYLCFHGSPISKKLVLRLADIKSITKQRYAVVFPNALSIKTEGKTYLFASFLSRDAAYRKIVNLWKLAISAGAENDEYDRLMQMEMHEPFFEDEEDETMSNTATDDHMSMGSGDLLREDSKSPSRRTSGNTGEPGHSAEGKRNGSDSDEKSGDSGDELKNTEVSKKGGGGEGHRATAERALRKSPQKVPHKVTDRQGSFLGNLVSKALTSLTGSDADVSQDRDANTDQDAMRNTRGTIGTRDDEGKTRAMRKRSQSDPDGTSVASTGTRRSTLSGMVYSLLANPLSSPLEERDEDEELSSRSTSRDPVLDAAGKTVDTDVRTGEPCNISADRVLHNEEYNIDGQRMCELLFGNLSLFLEHMYPDRTEIQWPQWDFKENATRQVSYVLPLKNKPIGPKKTRALEDQRYHSSGNGRCVHVEHSTPEVPYGSSFSVIMHYCIQDIDTGRARLVVTAHIHYIKELWSAVKTMIESATWEDLKAHCARIDEELSKGQAELDALMRSLETDRRKSDVEAQRKKAANALITPGEGVSAKEGEEGVIEVFGFKLFGGDTGQLMWRTTVVLGVIAAILVALDFLLLFEVVNLERDVVHMQQTLLNDSAVVGDAGGIPFVTNDMPVNIEDMSLEDLEQMSVSEIQALAAAAMKGLELDEDMKKLLEQADPRAALRAMREVLPTSQEAWMAILREHALYYLEEVSAYKAKVEDLEKQLAALTERIDRVAGKT
eukprot:Clim_evm3s252 gene=Clim_evmTU3s252